VSNEGNIINKENINEEKKEEMKIQPIDFDLNYDEVKETKEKEKEKRKCFKNGRVLFLKWVESKWVHVPSFIITFIMMILSFFYLILKVDNDRDVSLTTGLPIMIIYTILYVYLLIELGLRMSYRTYTYFFDFHNRKVRWFDFKAFNWREIHIIVFSWYHGIEVLNILEFILFMTDIVINIVDIIFWFFFISK
jgi:hypothetical protein